MTIDELREILARIKFNTKQVQFTLGSKKFRILEVNWSELGGEPIEIKLEEIKSE